MAFASLFTSSQLSYGLIYVLSVLFALHNVLVIYTNSTFIEQYIPNALVGALYVLGSAIAVLAFLFINSILRRLGNVRLTICLASIEIVTLLILGLATHPPLLILAFVAFLIINPLIYLNLDIFSETIIGDQESSTGHKRGLVLTLMSAAAVIGPLAIGPIVGSDNSGLHRVYLLSATIFSMFILLILLRFRSFQDPQYSTANPIAAVRDFWRDTNIRFSLLAQFMLQIVFSWMVIYVPLYLATEIGLSWTAIGTIISLGLIAYVLLEFPIGYLADNNFGEKEMMSLGFMIISFCVIGITVLQTTYILPWIALMFTIRIGASLVETTVESYFFKHTKGDDTNYMSFFRLTRPLAITCGGMLGSASLLFFPLSHIFVILGSLTISGVYFAYQLVDTR